MTKCRRAKMTRGENNPVYSKCSISEIPYEILCHYYKILLNANNNFNLYEHKQSIFLPNYKQKLSMRSSIRYIPLMHSVHLKIYNQFISPGNIIQLDQNNVTFCTNFYNPSSILYDAIKNTLIRF